MRRRSGGLLGVLCALALVLPACGAVDHGVTPPQPAAATADAREAAVRGVIERANGAQAKAFNSGDPTLMRATATDAFYARLVETDRQMRASGVRSLELASIEFVDMSVAASSAKATTLETWRSTYADGSADEQTARNEYALVLANGAWRIDSDDQPAAMRQPAPPVPDTGTPATASVTSTSTNWSGYSATGGKFTSVTATWTVPSVSTATAGADATWVGIGGIDTRDLIQAGTQATVSGGAVTYESWIEMLPDASHPVPLAVTAGDSVTVTIAQKSATEWTITLANDTTGGRYTTTVRYASSNSSAEWVQEAPSAGRGLVPLDDFGTLRFSRATAVRDGKPLDLQTLGASGITMVNGARQPLATPSAIGADGASFSVTRTRASSTPQRRRGG